MFYLILEFYKLKKKLALKSTLNYCLGNVLFLILSSLSLFHSPTFWVLKLLDNYRFLGESDDCYQLFFH